MGVISASPCLSRHDRTSPWLPPPHLGPGSVSTPSPNRYVQPHLLHYLVQRHPGSTGPASRRTSTAAGSSCKASSPGSTSVFHKADFNATQHQSVPTGVHAHNSASQPVSHSSAVRLTDWRCGLRPSGAVSFRAVVNDEDSRSSATEDHSSHQQNETAHVANAYQCSRLI